MVTVFSKVLPSVNVNVSFTSAVSLSFNVVPADPVSPVKSADCNFNLLLSPVSSIISTSLLFVVTV